MLLLPLGSYAQAMLFDAAWIDWLDTQAEPLLKAANIDPATVEIRLLNDNTLNAFVTPDRQIYFHTGLLLEADNANEVIGVLAHEIGHIQGRHNLKFYQNLDKQKIPLILGGLAGIGAAAAGSGDAAIALMMSGQATATSNLLRHSRASENEADRTAFTLLNETGQTATGMVSFMEKLNNQTLYYSQLPPPYLTTHPMPPERISSARYHVESRETGKQLSDDSNLQPDFEYLQARLYALTHTPADTLRRYTGKDATALQAQAIALANQGKLDASLDKMAQLNTLRPNDPYLYELIAQAYIDAGNLAKAVEAYAKALQQRPNDIILRYQYGLALRLNNQFDQAVAEFQRVRQQRPQWMGPARQLGLAYGGAGKMAESHFWLLVAAIESGDKTTALTQRALAKQYIKEGDPLYQELIRLSELVDEAKE